MNDKRRDYEFSAPPLKTDVKFSEWFAKEREVRGHVEFSQTAKELGIHRSAVRPWLDGEVAPRQHAMIVSLSKWSGVPIRLIRGMIEYESSIRGQQTIEIQDHTRAQPWRAVPLSRQELVMQWLRSQIEFFDKQSGSLREFATALRSAREELKKQAELSRNALKELEIVRPSSSALSGPTEES